MKITLFGLSALVCMAAFADTPTITGVTAQQRYPWNGKVDISYTITGDIAEYAKQSASVVSLNVTAKDVDADITYTATTLSGDTTLTAGSHAIVWDMGADGLAFKSTNVVFKVECETTPALYCVIDLSAGSSASSYPVTYLAEPPSGGFNTDEYKTTKLVLRKVNKGSNSAGGSMSKDMWVGIFEVTERQYVLVSGSFTATVNSSSSYTAGNQPTSAVCSLCSLSGSSRSTSFLSRIVSRTGVNARLPSPAEWEYACRAGTTTAYNNGTSANMNEVGWCSSNRTVPTSKYYSQKVGMKNPNAWGLYDMHGNVGEQVTGSISHLTGEYAGYYFGGGCLNKTADLCTSSDVRAEIFYTRNSFNYDSGLRVFADVQ